MTDPAGAAIPDAHLKATAKLTGMVFETISDKVGVFHINLIPPGEYKVEISKQNFASRTLEGIVVSTGMDFGLGTVVLGVAGTTQSVQVTDNYTPLIETTQAEVSISFPTEQLGLVAGLAENEGLDNLALLVPGVSNSRDNSFSNSNGASFDVNGLRGRSTDQEIDGQNNNDNSVAGPYIFMTDSEFVSEYQIVTNNFGPEYGRNAGAVVNNVIKSGTNSFHGGVFANENFAQLNTLTNIQKVFSGLTKVPSANDQFAGFTLGGPIKKDKLFFFGGFDEEFYHTGDTYTSSGYTPTTAGLTTLSSITGVDPNALAALKRYSPFAISAGSPFAYSTTTGVVTIGTKSYTIPFAAVQRSVPYNSEDRHVVGKVDYQIGKNTIATRYILQKNPVKNLASSGPAGWFYDEPSQSQAFKTGWTRTFSPKLVNELALAFGRENTEFGGGATGTIPDAGSLKSAVASVSISRVAGNSGNTGLGYGGGNTLPQSRVVNTWQAQDNLIFDMGSHHFKAGVNWTYQRSLNVFLPNVNGTYSFTNFSTYLTNTPASVSVGNGNPNLDFREYDTFMYAGDDWKIGKNFTLNYGVTWSLYGQPANLFNTNDTKLQNSSTPLWGSAYAAYAVFPKLPNDNTDVGPNVGFAWSPAFLNGGGHQTVIRGGYRLAYDPPFYNIYLNISSSAPQVLAQTITSGTSGTLPANPTGPNVRSALSSVLTLGVYDPRLYYTTNVSNNFRSDRVQSWSLGIQRELTKQAVVEARYVGNSGDRLFQTINGSPYLAGVKALYPNYANVTLLSNGRTTAYSKLRTRANTGYSAYNGLQTQLRADHLFHQLFLQTGYTWSKTTDNASEIFSTSAGGNTIAIAQNPLDYKHGEHGLSGLDEPQTWTVSFAETIPFFREQHGFVGKTLGGWGIAGNYMLASGEPYTPYQYYFSYITSTYGGYNQVVDASFNASVIGTYDGGLRPFLGNKKASPKAVGVYAGDADIYFGTTGASSTTLLSFNDLENGSVTTTTTDKVRYIANGPTADSIYGTPYGTAGRNMSRDYWTNTATATISKNFKVRERWDGQLRATFYNVFNHRNYTSVDAELEDAGDYANDDSFGDPTVTSGGNRTIYFGAYIHF